MLLGLNFEVEGKEINLKMGDTESPQLHASRWDVGGKEGGNKVRVGRLTSAERCRSRIKMKAETRQRCQIRGRNNEGKTKELKHDECWWSQAGRSDAMKDTDSRKSGVLLPLLLFFIFLHLANLFFSCRFSSQPYFHKNQLCHIHTQFAWWALS